MTDENPYTAPDAELDSGSQELYQPSIFSFQGRIGRLRYLAYGIGLSILMMIVIMPVMFMTVGLGAFMGGGESFSPMVIVMFGVFLVASFIITIMFGKRRFNDLGRTGWWSILLLVPYVMLIPAIYLIFFAGNQGDNHYGAAPCENSLGVKIVALLLPVTFVIGIVAAIAIPMIAGN